MSDANKVELKVRVFSQRVRNSCWLAAYKMLISYKDKNRNVADSEIEDAFDQAKLNFKNAKIHGLNESDFPKACKVLGLELYGVPFGYGEAEEGAVKILLEYLKNHGPLWVAGKWTGTNHVNVVHGADIKREMLCCIDPWNDGISASKPLWVDFDNYVKGVKVKVRGGIQHW